MDLHPGARLGDRYNIQQRLGAGGMGEVWLAVDEVLRRTVAVKAMLPEVARDPGFARRFAAEATAMARLNHPAVASIHDYGTSHGIAYLVMEFVDGESLSQRLARDGRLTPKTTMRLVADTAAGLQAVHDQGLVHRDIKPANLLLRRDGTVVITDFGIARHEDASLLTASGAILGTPSYLSPEQVRGEPAAPASDIYALGLVAYECLAGERPFTGDNPYAVALQRLQSTPRTIAVTLPAPVRELVSRALATNPHDRWPSAAALSTAARQASSPAAADTVPSQGPQAAPRHESEAAPSPGPRVAPSQGPQAAPRHESEAAPSPGPRVAPSQGPQEAPSQGPQAAPPANRHRALLAALAAALLLAGGLLAGTLISKTGTTGDKPAAAGTASTGSDGTTGRDGTTGSDGKAGNDGTSGSDAKTGGDGTTDSNGTTGSEAATTPAGFITCGDSFCPAEPLCWSGPVIISGKAAPPRRLACSEPHFWQTYQAVPAPTDEIVLGEADPIERPDLAAACTSADLADRSKDPATTKGWKRSAWPIPSGDTPLVHCLVGSPDGESTGDLIRP